MLSKDLERMLPGAHWSRTRALYKKEYMTMAFVGVRGVSEEFGVSEVTVYRKVKEGVIPHMRVGRQLRFDLEECRAFFASKGARMMSEAETAAEACRRC